MKDEPRTVESVEKSFEIISILSQRGSTSVTELAEITSRSKGNISTYLTTLKKWDYVRQDPDSQKFELGIEFVIQAEALKSLRIPDYEFVNGRAKMLVEDIIGYANLVIEEEAEAFCLEQYGGQEQITPLHHAGNSLPLHATASGKVLLAWLPEDEQMNLLEKGGINKLTENTITQTNELMRELDTVKKEGIAYNQEETTKGICAVAGPIKAVSGDVVAAISIYVPSQKFKEDGYKDELTHRIEEFVQLLDVKKFGN